MTGLLASCCGGSGGSASPTVAFKADNSCNWQCCGDGQRQEEQKAERVDTKLDLEKTPPLTPARNRHYVRKKAPIKSPPYPPSPATSHHPHPTSIPKTAMDSPSPPLRHREIRPYSPGTYFPSTRTTPQQKPHSHFNTPISESRPEKTRPKNTYSPGISGIGTTPSPYLRTPPTLQTAQQRTPDSQTGTIVEETYRRVVQTRHHRGSRSHHHKGIASEADLDLTLRPHRSGNTPQNEPQLEVRSAPVQPDTPMTAQLSLSPKIHSRPTEEEVIFV